MDSNDAEAADRLDRNPETKARIEFALAHLDQAVEVEVIP